jgi:hypothetical protein
VLTGNPGTEKEAPDAYRFFKRDTILKAMAEVNALTDIDVELIEHRQGRRVEEIQFRITPKRQAQLKLAAAVEPVDLSLVTQAQRLGVAEATIEALVREHGDVAVRESLAVLERRVASAYPQPLNDPTRYLRALMPAPGAPAQAQEPAAASAAAKGADTDTIHKRRAYWLAEWIRRRRQAFADEIRALAPERQAELEAALLADLHRRNVHPTLAGRLQKNGWQHPMVVGEMVRFYAQGAHGDDWDKPGPEDLLAIAAELGEGG